MSLKWQWLYSGAWVDCTPENIVVLNARHKRPSLEPLYMVNDCGNLWGTPEDFTMKFRIHGDDEETRTMIRRAPTSAGLTIFEVKDGPVSRIIPPEACAVLFHDNNPSVSERILSFGTEEYMAKDGELFMKKDRKWTRKNVGETPLNVFEYKDAFSTRYSWEFRGPFRWERMQMAVSATSNELSGSRKKKLLRLMSRFDPTEDATEYGPFQFPDYLSSVGEDELAIMVGEKYHDQSLGEWNSFGPMANCRIEKARSDGRPMAMIQVRGHLYMIIFDSGSGASGSGPVVIRPSRYQKILESIEEQFEASSSGTRSDRLASLFDLLVENNINPRQFLMRVVVEPDNIASLIPEPIRDQVATIMEDMDSEHDSSGMATRIQQFMPALLDKFKECEIRLSHTENLSPKQLCEPIVETFTSGLSVPSSFNCNWQEMVEFIHKHQCWKCNGPKSACDICGDRTVGFTHCGNSRACLKCWSSTLVETKFTCPFCRKDVMSGDLKLAKRATANRKRKRLTEMAVTKMNYVDILDIVKKDNLYKDISEDTSFAMRKWFTILLRRGLVNIHQRPKNDQASKKFKDAVKIFKLV